MKSPYILFLIAFSLILSAIVFSVINHYFSPSDIKVEKTKTKVVNVIVPPAPVNVQPIDTLYANGDGNNHTHIKTYKGCYYVLNEFRGHTWGSHMGDCPNKIHYTYEMKLDSLKILIQTVLLNQSIINERLIKIEILSRMEVLRRTKDSLLREIKIINDSIKVIKSKNK